MKNEVIQNSTRGAVAHCVESFPKLSETFIHGKVSWLLDNGYPVRVVDKWKASREYRFFSECKQDLFKSISTALYPYESRLGNRVIRCADAIEPTTNLMLRGKINAVHEACHRYCDRSVHSAMRDLAWSINPLLYYRFCRRNSISVAHVHFGFNALEWIPVKRILGNGLRLIVSVLGQDVTVVPKEHPRIYDKLFQTADLFLASSHFLKALAIEYGCPEEKIIVHPVEIDTDFFRPPADRTDGGKKTILSVGRLVWEKDYDTALRTMSCLKERLPHLQWQYRIVGDGPLRDKLENEIASLGLTEHIVLVGSKTQDEVREEMRKSDLFFMPSISEGLGASALEAAACGLPVVASRVGGLQEVVVDGHTGVLGNAQNAEWFAEQIARLLGNENMRIAFGTSGRAHVVSGYSAGVLYRRLPEYYWLLSGK